MRRTALVFLASDLLSLLGNGIAAVALPLIVLSTTGSPLDAGTVAVATAVPAVLVGLGAGVLLDRFDRRTVSVVSDVLSAGAVAALPLVDLVWGLDLGWFVLLGILGSFGDVPGMTAREVLVPAVARRSGMALERLIGLREALGAVALLLGPAAAGTMMVLLEGSTVLWVTAATSGAAALVTLALPRAVGAVDPATVANDAVGTRLRAGFTVLRRSRVLLGATALGAGLVLVLGALQGLVLPLWFSLVDRPGLFGFVLSALAAGTLVGAGAFAAVGSRVPRRTALLVGLAGVTGGFILIGALPSPWLVLAGAVVVGLAGGALGGSLGVAVVEATPEAVRGRVLGVQNALAMVAAPAGIAMAAVVAEYVSVVAAGLSVAGLWVAVVVVVLGTGSLRGSGREVPVHAQR